MTRDEAINVAIEALHYVLENDDEYLSPGALHAFTEAANVLAQSESDNG